MLMRRYSRYVGRLAYELPSVSIHGCVLHLFAVFSVIIVFGKYMELRSDGAHFCVYGGTRWLKVGNFVKKKKIFEWYW